MFSQLKPLFFLLVICLFGCQPTQESKPNIILIVADDLGYGELGAYGQKIIQTPNLDALAANGMKFNQFYAGSPVCAPSRYVLLTGLHTGHSFIRGNDEWAERGKVWNYKEATKNPGLEGQRPIPDSTVLLSEVMKKAGYQTAVIGKWGLGAPFTEGEPNQQGFDYFYGYNCQRQAHNLYPVHLWENDHKVALKNDTIPPGTKLSANANPNDQSAYADYYQADYAPEKMQESALSFIKNRESDSPFLLYYATPIPHVPLQVPEAYVEKYRKIIGEEEPYLGQRGYFPHQYPKAAYAGMINYLDDQIGELIDLLKSEGIYENTIIMFTSDNGPTYAGGVDADYFNSAGPFSNDYGRTKGFTYEGGIRVPMIASWPGKIAPASTTEHISAFYDILPTLASIGGGEITNSIDGKSFLPTLIGKEQESHDHLYWEFPEYKGQQAVRMGNFKAIRKNMFEGNLTIELYDLTEDPKELVDISNENPEIVERINKIMVSEHEDAALSNFRIPVISGQKKQN
ncbi:arylsulfatase [Roseivirga misakiensis]|uniref:N-acetylgalactosamine-6-sulfatase n=1 Tax=Roseivirga misakiensis TaxID=1563681 RepID=A0A1E5T133_9BACT|nr:arylsulfatase [Roseivirga misakiensis]OEK05088.1 N-acetylgalactosamine-6-sulfatase [Roseivirga misakiensis]